MKTLGVVNSERAKLFLGDWPLLLIILVSAKGASFLSINYFRWALLIFSGFMYFRSKRNIDLHIVAILFFWFIINLLSFIYNQTEFSMKQMRNVMITIMTSYFLLKIAGPSLLIRLEKVIFILSIITVPFYIVQLAFPQVLVSFAPFLNFMTSAEQKVFNGWYIFFYMFSGYGLHIRNCGFMWEPGAFAFMLILAILIHFHNNGIKLDFIVIFYLLLIASTLSTMGYVVGLLLIATVLVMEKKPLHLIILLLGAILLLPKIIELEFVLPEIQEYIGLEDQVTGRSSELSGGYLRVTRWGMLLISIKQSLKWPLGYGMVIPKEIAHRYKEMILGVGTISYVLLRWGWIGLYYLVLSLNKVVNNLFSKFNLVTKIILLASLLLAFASNPLENEPILYCLVFYPHFFRSTDAKLP